MVANGNIFLCIVSPQWVNEWRTWSLKASIFDTQSRAPDNTYIRKCNWKMMVVDWIVYNRYRNVALMLGQNETVNLRVSMSRCSSHTFRVGWNGNHATEAFIYNIQTAHCWNLNCWQESCWLLALEVSLLSHCSMLDRQKELALKYLFFFQLDVLDKFGVEFFFGIESYPRQLNQLRSSNLIKNTWLFRFKKRGFFVP